jgi:hypothetical protein
MKLIKQAVDNLRDLLFVSHNIQEIIPGWDDDYPEPMFTDDWRLTSEIDLSSDYDNEIDTDYLFELVGFSDDEEQYLELTSGCNDCKYFHGVQYNDVDFICGIHPFGNSNCSDFETKYGIESSELIYEPDDYDLTEKDELIATYGWHNYEFVKDRDWVSDDLDNYLGKYQG